jgi:large subunit ribosomal protein L29
MKASKLRDMTTDELQREAKQLRRSLFNLRLQQATGQLEKPHKLGEARRDLARAKTILRQRGQESEEATR